MKRIEWSEEISVGIELLDSQHQKLLELCNKLIDVTEKKSDSSAISSALTMMTEYAERHFESEEKLMRTYFFPELDEHVKEHDCFREKTVKYCLSVMSYDDNVLYEMIEFLQEWILHHVVVIDMKYKAYFLEKGII